MTGYFVAKEVKICYIFEIVFEFQINRRADRNWPVGCTRTYDAKKKKRKQIKYTRTFWCHEGNSLNEILSIPDGIDF